MAIIVIYVYLYYNLFWFLIQAKSRFGGSPKLFLVKPRSGSELGGENLLHIIVNFFLQIGLLVLVHNLIEIGIESGFLKALFEIITLQYNYQMDFSFFHLG